MLYLDGSTVAELCRTVDPLEVVTSALLAVRSGDAAVGPEASLRWTSSDGTAARSLALPARHGDARGLVGSAQDAMRRATVTFAATTTTTPYVELSWLRPGAVFVNVSLDDATEGLLLGCDHLFVDDIALAARVQAAALERSVGLPLPV